VNEPVWLAPLAALVLHDRLLALDGGAPGLRDEALLDAALARPRQHAAYGEATDLVWLAALYTASIVQSHPFVDGNKRTGFVMGVLFLELNGLLFEARQEDAAHAVMALAAGELSERGYATFLAANTRRAAPPA
jgi:death on curing protein